MSSGPTWLVRLRLSSHATTTTDALADVPVRDRLPVVSHSRSDCTAFQRSICFPLEKSAPAFLNR